jgi:hypothetical protein
MNRTPDVELVLREFLADDGIAAPDYILDVVEDRISRQRQQRTWRLLWRLPMNPLFKLTAAAAAVLILAVVGWNLLPGPNGPGVGSSPTPGLTPSPEPTASAGGSPTPIACEDGLPGCAGRLDAGAYSSVHFEPGFGFTVPQGWKNVIDTPSIFKLDPPAILDSRDAYILMWSMAEIANQPTCDGPGVPVPGTGERVEDWILYLANHPGLNVTAPASPIARGSVTGQAIDVQVDATWTGGCPANGGAKVVNFILDHDSQARDVIYGATSDSRMHLEFLDVGGTTVIVQVYTPTSDGGYADAMAKVRPILESMNFDAGG